jgi:hypothetical protein
LGIDRTNVLTLTDNAPDGALLVSFAIQVESHPLDAAARATLRTASAGTDAEVRTALISMCGAAWGAWWDRMPSFDADPTAPAVSTRARFRAALGRLPT